MKKDFSKYHLAIKYWLLGKGYHKAVSALEFGAKYHDGVRKDGVTPEFHHQISIAHYLRTLPNLRNQEDVLVSAFLHDIVEDYDVSLNEIESKFGYDVKKAVGLLSREIDGEKKTQDEYFRGMHECPIASIVKGGDRIHNSQTLIGVFTKEKQQAYVEETETYILPMLKRARNKFPDQELAYENVKHALKGQIEFIKVLAEA